MNGKKVLMAMSGGVDSSAAAVLLQRQGYRVDGAMLNLLPEGNDTADARAVADRLGMDFLLLEGSGDFAAEVMDRFVSEYCAGRTPNPCIDCNRCLKFGLFLDRALELGYDYIATGHYARVEKAEGGKFRLLRGLDRKKDQSYMLYQLTQQQLSHLLLPVGEYDKPAIREFAREAGLENADKSDSQDICFIPDGDYAAYIENALGVTFPEGDICDTSGNVIGRHKGLIRYTIGQRKGIGAYGKPMFVKKIDAANNRLILGASGDEYEDTLEADGLIFSGAVPFEGTIECEVKHRYHAPATLCTVTVKDGIATAHLHTPARAITPGQSAVFYDGDRILFGGFIK